MIIFGKYSFIVVVTKSTIRELPLFHCFKSGISDQVLSPHLKSLLQKPKRMPHSYIDEILLLQVDFSWLFSSYPQHCVLAK
jgi:hypothetical protein